MQNWPEAERWQRVRNTMLKLAAETRGVLVEIPIDKRAKDPRKVVDIRGRKE